MANDEITFIAAYFQNFSKDFEKNDRNFHGTRVI